MRVRFWGTRGSIPTPGPGTVRYGGNTSCVEVRTDAGGLLVVDCGTGARALGQHLVAGDPPRQGSLLISHTHWDHIHGLPFFAPLFATTMRWDIYGPRGLAQSLDRTLAGQMEYQYFPVALDEVAADVHFHDLVEGVFETSGATVTTHYLNHPALTLGYRIEADGATVVYASDHERPANNAGHVEFLRDADLVIHDSQYEEANYGPKQGWGHSTMEYVVDSALEAGVRRLALYHHDPARDDDGVDDLLARARQRAGDRLEIIAAIEGETVEVVGRGATSARRAVPATRAPAVDELRPPVVVAVEDSALAQTVRAAAEAEGLPIVTTDTGVRGAVVVVDEDEKTPSTSMAASAYAMVSLVVPCSVAYVRTKLRAAVLRRASRWLAAPRAPDEDARIAALHELNILDTPEEERFDRLAESARAVADTPIALITLVDSERQWFKSHLGYEGTESHRDMSVCAHAILADDVMQVPDALDDPRFADNPAVTGESRVRFYAGAPLELRNGCRVGTLCVVDHRPRLLDDEQVAELKRLAAKVVDELEANS